MISTRSGRTLSVGVVVYDGLDELSGGYRYDRKLVEYLRAAGDEIDVITVPRRCYPRQFRDNISQSLHDDLNQPFDILLQDELCHPSLLGVNRRLGAPDSIVTVAHLLRSGGQTTLFDPIYRWLERQYLQDVDGVVCTSEHTRTWVRGLSSTPAIVAPPGGRTEETSRTPPTARRHAFDEPFRILFLGNVVPRKGADTLIDALDGLSGDWRATIAGDTTVNPRYGDRIEARTDDSDRIEVVGAVSDERLHDLLAEAHILAVPSRYESFGMVYLEAMEWGTVPVATRAGGATDVVEDGVNGFLVPPDDPKVLRQILESLRDDRVTLETVATNALETATDHPTWTETMERVREFLLTIAETPAYGCRSQPSTDQSIHSREGDRQW